MILCREELYNMNLALTFQGGILIFFTLLSICILWDAASVTLSVFSTWGHVSYLVRGRVDYFIVCLCYFVGLSPLLESFESPVLLKDFYYRLQRPHEVVFFFKCVSQSIFSQPSFFHLSLLICPSQYGPIPPFSSSLSSHSSPLHFSLSCYFTPSYSTPPALQEHPFSHPLALFTCSRHPRSPVPSPWRHISLTDASFTPHNGTQRLQRLLLHSLSVIGASPSLVQRLV